MYEDTLQAASVTRFVAKILKALIWDSFRGIQKWTETLGKENKKKIEIKAP